MTSRLFWSTSVGLRVNFILFHSCNRLFQFPSRHCSQDIAVWKKNFATFGDLSVVHVGDQVLRFLTELVDLLRLSQILNERMFILVVLGLLDQPLDFVLACCVPRLDCRKRYSSYSVVRGAVTSFSVTVRVTRWFPR